MEIKITIGVKVTRFSDNAFGRYFHCRIFWHKRKLEWNIEDWADNEVADMRFRAMDKIKVGETRRYKVDLLLWAHRIDFEEWDGGAHILRVKRM